ncbi:hypothetical protein SHO565_55420 [Streptomyces sp. HO565]
MPEGYGYEPAREGPARLRLRNRLFHPLAAKAPDLVCGMNQAFLSGYLTGLEVNGVQAVLAPRPANAQGDGPGRSGAAAPARGWRPLPCGSRDLPPVPRWRRPRSGPRDAISLSEMDGP